MHQQTVMASLTGTSVPHQIEHDDDASVPTPPKFQIKGLMLLEQLLDVLCFFCCCCCFSFCYGLQVGFRFNFCMEQNIFNVRFNYVSEIPIALTLYLADPH